MHLSTVAEQGWRAVLLIIASITTALLAAYFIGKLLGAESNEKILIGVGTAICGGSAIAAASPVIKASDKEVARAVSTIFLFNVIAVFVFPLLGRLFGMDDAAFGTWAGAAINDTSSVVSAAYSFSDAAGDTATVVKLTRTLFIIPVTLGLALFKSKDESPGGFKIYKAFPLFAAFFLLACIINTTGIIPSDFTTFWGKMSKFMIVLAMAAIGLSTNIRELIRHGIKPILLGLCCSLSVAVISILLLRYF
jgi:uncharacterized integral membrane protein (TIGR00698 family)